MSFGIALKGAEGIVLAADSRVTLFNEYPGAVPGTKVLVPSTFDNASKILRVPSQKHIAAVTFGAGTIGLTEPRTAASFVPEFEAEHSSSGRMSVEEFATKLGAFFGKQWAAANMPNPAPAGEEMVFMVAGYDEQAAYGALFSLSIPSQSKPNRMIPDGMFGAQWGGQNQFVNRLMQGFDPSLPEMVQTILNIPPAQRDPDLVTKLTNELAIPIPWQFLPLQDCIDLSIFLVRTTITLQTWTVGIRGVGGSVDVVAITRTQGVLEVQVKQVMGENRLMERR